jgi:outer membrane immunogenic protein
MNRLRNSSLALMVLIAAPAAAADLPATTTYKAPEVAAPPSWSGFYIGLGIGTRTSVVDSNLTAAIDTALPGDPNLLGPLYCSGLTPCVLGQPLDSTTFRLSPYVGFNWQVGPQWLVGLEGDWGWAKGGRTLTGMFVPGGNGNSNFLISGQPENTYAVNTTWDATLRARLGWIPVQPVLLYLTGGGAWLHVEQASVCGTVPGLDYCSSVGFAPSVVTDAATRTGWTAGGGLEAMLGGHWIARAEYRYADFGTWSPSDVRTCPTAAFGPCLGSLGATLTTTTAVHIRTHTATVGLAYKF